MKDITLTALVKTTITRNDKINLALRVPVKFLIMPDMLFFLTGNSLLDFFSIDALLKEY